MRWMDRWAARAQRKSDERAARWREVGPLRELVSPLPVLGPGGSEAVISVAKTGQLWLDWWVHPVPGTFTYIGGWVYVPLAVSLLVSEAVWWLVFHRSYTVHVRTNGQPPVKISVRLPDEAAAYNAAVILMSRFLDDGHAALPGWQADFQAARKHRGRIDNADTTRTR